MAIKTKEGKVLKGELEEMMESYQQMKTHLTEKGDRAGREILGRIIESSSAYIDGLFALHEKVVEQKTKELLSVEEKGKRIE